MIPTPLAERVGLEEVGRREFEGLGGQRHSLPLYRLLLTIAGCPSVTLDAAGTDGEPYILLGRDVLNRFNVVLDGPGQRVVIG